MISFWSPVVGKGSVSVTTAVVALSHQLIFPKEKILLTNTVTNESYFDYFKSRISVADDLGIRRVVQFLVSQKLNREVVQQSTYAVTNSDVELLSWNRTTLVDEVLSKIYIYLDSIKGYNNLYVDLGSGMIDSLRARFIEDSDIVVVCISQETSSIDEVMRGISALKEIGKKFIVVVGSYDSESRMDKRFFKTLLGLAGKNVVFSIPYLTEIKDLALDGNLAGITKSLDLEIKKFAFKTTPILTLKSELTAIHKVINGGAR